MQAFADRAAVAETLQTRCACVGFVFPRLTWRRATHPHTPAPHTARTHGPLAQQCLCMCMYVHIPS